MEDGDNKCTKEFVTIIYFLTMKNIKRILLLILILPVCMCSLGASSFEQGECVCETKSNLLLGATKADALYHTNSPLYKDLFLLDDDGDGITDYIIEHSLMDIFGGHGNYDINIYAKTEDNRYGNVVFNSTKYLSVHENMDIEIKDMRDGVIVFKHHKKEYEIEYAVDEYTYPYLFNTDGSPKGTPNFVIDTFKTVKVVDVDNDGSDELLFEQYASLGWRANGFADCVTVFKFIENEFTLISIELIIT